MCRSTFIFFLYSGFLVYLFDKLFLFIYLFGCGRSLLQHLIEPGAPALGAWSLSYWITWITRKSIWHILLDTDPLICLWVLILPHTFFNPFILFPKKIFLEFGLALNLYLDLDRRNILIILNCCIHEHGTSPLLRFLLFPLITLLLFSFLAMPRDFWDLNSQTRDWIQVLGSETSEF